MVTEQDPPAAEESASLPVLLVDWGTTNRRVYLVERGRILREHDDTRGVLSIDRAGWETAISEISRAFEDVEAQDVKAQDVKARFTLMAGMVGSNRGLAEAPYVPCPVGLDDLVKNVLWVRAGSVAIVPGVSFLDPPHADVMRGEEVQVLGAIEQGSLPSDCLVCHPGTHNKWIRIESGRIASFRTVMTGELFNLLRKHSILSDLFDGEPADDGAFAAGVDHAIANSDLISELFRVRARVLLGASARKEAASYVSGLLIGSDVRIGLGAEETDAATDVVYVLGSASLTQLYVAAISRTGRRAVGLDDKAAFVAGMSRIAERLR
jgi:2-dehydro-3-deoxygalactonokinase